MRSLALCMAAAVCVLGSCGKSGAPVPKVAVPAEAACIVWLSRCLETGDFEPFVIEDAETVNRVRSALAEDVKIVALEGVHVGISDDNWLVLIGKEGGAHDYTILGDHYVYVGGVYLSAQRTMAALRAAEAEGRAHRVSWERAESLVPEAEDWRSRQEGRRDTPATR
ncbi:MAG: hypothetical protein GX591_15590 [Planctomycetes bacterium]|nr:hypothetical protein [Planctomycetota bacterium]